MKKTAIWIISIITLVILAGIILILTLTPRTFVENPQYSCNVNSDCVSQCQRGCVNYDWAGLNPDTTECFRAWTCSCVDNQCYTDGKPRA